MADDKPDKEFKFELKMVAQVNPSKVKTAPPVDPERAERRHVQETGRREMEKYREEMTLGLVYDFRTCKDYAHRFKIAKYFIDQTIGSPKPLTEEEKKGADAGTILDALAAMSGIHSALEREGKATPPVLEHQQPEEKPQDISGLLDQFDNDIEDGEIIDG